MDSVIPFDWLDADPRPTCVLDLRKCERNGEPHVESSNRALREQSHLLAAVLDRSSADDSGARARVWAWMIRDRDGGGVAGSCEWIAGSQLYAYTVKQRWRVIQWQPAVESTFVDHKMNVVPGSGSAKNKGVLANNGMDTATNGMPKDGLPVEPSTRSDPLPEQELLADRNNVTEKLVNTLTMIEMVDVGMFDYNTEGKLLHANEAFYKLSGHPRPSEAKEFSWLDCVFPEDKDYVFGFWGGLLAGETCNFEMKWKRPAAAMPNGEEDINGQWVLAACVPTRNEDDSTIRSISGCITDIAAQKRSQEDALKKAEALERASASEKRFTRFADTANIGIFLLSLDFELLYCNHGWFLVTGHVPTSNYADVDWRSVLSEQGNAMIDDQWDLMTNKKQAVSFQCQLRREWSNGQGGQGPAWVLASAYPELSNDGRVLSVAGTLTDISQLVWAESVQKLRTEEAIEAKRQQDNFIDMTSHEIRNPLGAVIHCADMIVSSLTDMTDLLGGTMSPLPADKRLQFEELRDGALESVNTIITCSSHQRRIVDDILSLSKLDSRLITIVPSPVRFDSILVEAAKMFDVDAKKAGVELRVAKDKSLGTLEMELIMLDNGRLMQVLINLVTNALKFTQKEAVRVVALTMGASRTKLSEQDLDVEFVPPNNLRERGSADNTDWGGGEEIYLYFKVSDTGCGFSDEQKVMIFARFAQASPRTHSQYGGTGLGLFITRELIELHGGEIGVSSRPGDGAAFAFYITARSVLPPKAAPGTSTPMTTSQQLEPKPGGTSYSILVVEDNLINQRVMRKQLEKLGHTVHVVSHGGEALAFIRTTSYWRDNTTDDAVMLEVVLMDIEMPVMNGFTCAREIRGAQARGEMEGHLPIIAVSANARQEQINHALECGMDDTIAKPFRILDLIPKIERLVPG
ncbi:hypothetical protein LTR10_005086 [Elasticomyces elasticus]|nr:hypothetical protein LTR10_005086 [Elasticomyces elasticus]KAK4975827.1 hypothetical protein LTR42_003448 [Elasticomyces elasticus]